MTVAARLGLETWEQLDSTQRGQYLALAIVEDWGNELHRQAEILAALHNLSLHVAAAAGARIRDSDLRTAADYLPGRPEEETTQDMREKLSRLTGH